MAVGLNRIPDCHRVALSRRFPGVWDRSTQPDWLTKVLHAENPAAAARSHEFTNCDAARVCHNGDN